MLAAYVGVFIVARGGSDARIKLSNSHLRWDVFSLQELGGRLLWQQTAASTSRTLSRSMAMHEPRPQSALYPRATADHFGTRVSRNPGCFKQITS